MKKIGIITLHRSANYGSVLQSYATQEIIKKMGNEVRIIDYRPERYTVKDMLRRLKDKNDLLNRSLVVRTIVRIILFPSYIQRYKNFSKFVDSYLDLTEQMYKDDKELVNAVFDFDIFCTGSDQVWNSDWNHGIDTALYLDFTDKKKIAYAASFGRKELFEWEKEKTKELLNKYDAISVREKSGVDILNDLGIKNVINVLDPTFLLNKDEWNKVASRKFDNQKYILVYNLNRNKKIYKYAKNLSKKTGLKVKYISYQLHDFYRYGKMYCNISVENFLSLLLNATYIIADSFHGVAFSLNFNKEFAVIYPNKFSERIQSLLALTNLLDRVAKDENDLSIFDEKIDYTSVNEIITQERNKSMNFLKENL